MNKYVIKYKSKARKFLDRNINSPIVVRILEYLWILENFNKAMLMLDIKKLKWYENKYRLRVWKYRILFEKYEDKLVILVIDIWSRWDVYK